MLGQEMQRGNANEAEISASDGNAFVAGDGGLSDACDLDRGGT